MASGDSQDVGASMATANSVIEEVTKTATFFVHGIPQSQGSTKAFVVKGRPVITSTNKNLHEWRDLIRLVAQEHATWQSWGAVGIDAVFLMPTPKTYPKTKEKPMVTRPDIDKLQRALFDALTGVFYRDDSQITKVTIEKRYGREKTGVYVNIWEV